MDDVVLRLSRRSQPLAIWYSKVLECDNATASTVAKAAIRAYAKNEIFIIGEINLNDPYEVKQFRIKFNDVKDADIIEYLKELSEKSARPIRDIIRSILLASLRRTTGPTKISILGDIIYAGLDYGASYIPEKEGRREVDSITVADEISSSQKPEEPKYEPVHVKKSEKNDDGHREKIKSTDVSDSAQSAWAGYGLK